MEPVVRVGVTVTFLRMDTPPADPAPSLALDVRYVRNCSVAFYRYLYNTVGGSYLWWLRRMMPDGELSALLRDPRVAIYVVFHEGEPAGFYELDSTHWPSVNLSYFGLMPHSVGTGIGYAFLRHAVDAVWRSGARAMTVNTCTADHPRALPTYQRAGFKPFRKLNEDWNIPVRLGMTIPAALRA